MDKRYTVAEVADTFRVTPATVREWLKDNKHPLVGIKPNGQWLVTETALKLALEAKHG